jgi:hypothetical protein
MSSDKYCDRCHVVINMERVVAMQIAASKAIPIKKPNNKYFYEDKGKQSELDKKLASYIRKGKGGGPKRWLHG